MSRKETRKEREARLRDEEKARLLESYQEGISNIEWNKVVTSDLEYPIRRNPER